MFSTSSETSSRCGSNVSSPKTQGARQRGAYVAWPDKEKPGSPADDEGCAEDLQSKMSRMDSILAELSFQRICAEEHPEDFPKRLQAGPPTTDRASIPQLLSSTENIAQNVKVLVSLVNEQQEKIEEIVEDTAKAQRRSAEMEEGFIRVVEEVYERVNPLAAQMQSLKKHLLAVAHETSDRIKTIEVDLAARKSGETEKETRLPASPQHSVEKRHSDAVGKADDEKDYLKAIKRLVKELSANQGVLECQQEKLEADFDEADTKRERIESTISDHKEIFTRVNSNINYVTSSLARYDDRFGAIWTKVTDIANETNASVTSSIKELKGDIQQRFATLRQSADAHMVQTDTRLTAVEQCTPSDDAFAKNFEDRVELAACRVAARFAADGKRLFNDNAAVLKEVQQDINERMAQTETRFAALEQRSPTECAVPKQVKDRIPCDAQDLATLRQKIDDHIACTETRFAPLEQRSVEDGITAKEMEDRIARTTQDLVTLQQSTEARFAQTEERLEAVEERSLNDGGPSKEVEDYMVQTEHILTTLCQSTDERFAQTEERLAAVEERPLNDGGPSKEVEDYMAQTEQNLATLRQSTNERFARTEGRLADVEERPSNDTAAAKKVDDRIADIAQSLATLRQSTNDHSAQTASRLATIEQRSSDDAANAKEVKNFIARAVQSLATLRRSTEERLAQTETRLTTTEQRSLNDGATAQQIEGRMARAEESLAALRRSTEERLTQTDVRLATVERPSSNNAATAKECSTLAGDLSTIRQCTNELQARIDTRLATLEQQRVGNDAVAARDCDILRHSISDHQTQTEMRLAALQRNFNALRQSTEEHQAHTQRRIDMLERQRYVSNVAGPAKDSRGRKDGARQDDIIKRMESLESQLSRRYDELAAKVASISVTPRFQQQNEIVMGELASFDGNVHDRVELFRGEHIKTVNLLRNVVMDLEADRTQLQLVKDDAQLSGDDVQAVRTSLQMVKEDVQAFRSDLQSIKKEVEAVGGDVLTVKDSVQTVKEDVQAFRSNLRSIKNEVQAVRGDVLTVKDNVQTMKEEMLTLKYFNAQVFKCKDAERHAPWRALR